MAPDDPRPQMVTVSPAAVSFTSYSSTMPRSSTPPFSSSARKPAARCSSSAMVLSYTQVTS